ncbi:hypothetical protein [Smaragdicoccus niigatensis]|uniref:hypothetical protein n=1 Tax=Smaragdicoccus niigatensis TaxID=359359 RepID=UPI000362BA08|nr:hypothetical protein [Smaragdicoccus niigatensis]
MNLEPRPRPKLVGPRETESTVYSEPYETSDGSTIIRVTRYGGRFRPGPRALGVFVIRDGHVEWSPVIDATRIAMLGETVGLVAATLGTIAMIRRPPWPDIRISRKR